MMLKLPITSNYCILSSGWIKTCSFLLQTPLKLMLGRFLRHRQLFVEGARAIFGCCRGHGQSVEKSTTSVPDSLHV